MPQGTNIKVTPIALNDKEEPQNTAQHAAIPMPEELDVIGNDNTDDFIMLSDSEEDVQPHPSARPIPLVNYASDSDTDFETPLSGQASPADRDAYLEFPSLTQPPSTRYVPPMYYTSPTGLGLKHKLTEDDLLSPSSEVEVLAVVKKEPEAVTL